MGLPGRLAGDRGVNADMSKAEKLGVDPGSLASSLTKKKEEPTT